MMAEFIFFWKDVSFSIFFHFFLIEESYAGNDKVHFITEYICIPLDLYHSSNRAHCFILYLVETIEYK